MYVYKFRHTKYLINSEYNELKNEELYFSHYRYLNDPLEGNVELVWIGDEIVWKNFLNHYLLCLFYKYTQLAHPDSNERFNDKIPIEITEKNIPKIYVDTYKQIKKQFFEDYVVSNILKYLSSKKVVIYKNELLNHIRIMNSIAMRNIVTTLFNNKLCENCDILKIFKSDEELNSLYLEVLRDFDRNPILGLEFFKRQDLLHEQTAIRCQVPLKHDGYKKRKMYLVNFPCIYVNQLYRLVFPDWYVCCFTESYTNSSMWGNYGDGHKGVCLRFKMDDKNEIKIQPITPTQINISNKYHPIKLISVNYIDEVLNIDFFRMLYNIPLDILEEYWYKDENGNESVCIIALKNMQNHLDKYNLIFEDACTRKTSEWHSEQEHRLIVRGMDKTMLKSGLKFRYNFRDLDAIIFGMKTPYSEMAEIIRIIANKCKEYRRSDFKFYISVYNSRSKKIEIEELKIVEEYMHEFAD